MFPRDKAAEPRLEEFDVQQVTDPVTLTQISYVEHRGTAGCLCFNSKTRSVLLVEQFRPVLGASALEIPSGRVEVGETPRTAAERETLEETGYRVSGLVSLGAVFSSVGLTNEVIHLFFTDEFDCDANRRPELVTQWTPLDRAIALMRRPEPVDAKTAIAIERAVNLIAER